jgi:dTDP-4-dehydrorhamnose reductase
VRLGDDYRNQFEETGHQQSLSDLDAIAALGITRLRYPVLWETVSPENPCMCDWRLADERLGRLRELGIDPIAGLLHHGSGPRYTNMMAQDFPALLARHAENVARRYPWLEMYTPVNEPLTTARFSGLYGHWYPHRRDIASFLRCLVNECMGTLLSMRAIRGVNPSARLVQTEDLGKIFSTPRLAYQADYENQRRWLSLDLLAGRIDGSHGWYETFIRHGITAEELKTFEGREAMPDIIGVNYYATSERYLDEALHLYPPCFHGRNTRESYADVEAVRVSLPAEVLGARARLMEVWERYRLPIAITEVHHGSTREEQLRWLAEVWHDACAAQREGADIRAVTSWSLLGAMDWNTLLTQRHGFYEPGAFDVRGAKPRLTAIGKALQEIAAGGSPSHPVLARQGWWRRGDRYYHPPAKTAPGLLRRPRMILVAGADGRLGGEIMRHCSLRGLDAAGVPFDEASEALAMHRPWAVIHAADVDARVTNRGEERLAGACSRHGIPFQTFSSDRVFDGALARPYVEGDAISPTCALGGARAGAERRVLRAHGQALVIRTSRTFGVEDRPEQLLSRHSAAWEAIPFLTGAYLPDLVRTALDLLIDGESGVWHLSNQGAMSRGEFARLFGIDDDNRRADRRLVVLSSERGLLMPSLRDAFGRHSAALAARHPGPSFAVAAE